MLKPDDPPRGQLLSPPVFFGSLFLVGFAPAMRGTCGSMLAAVLAIALWAAGTGQWGWWIGAAAFSLLSWGFGVWALQVATSRKDPGWFVLDEAAGLFLVLALVRADSFLEIGAAFVAFRLYDIAKPWPVRSFERLPGSLGILADDLAAGVLAAWTVLVMMALV